MELIITEKPAAAQKIANALADGKPIKKTNNKVSYYEITRGNQDIIVSSAVGHLYTVEEVEKKGFEYPVFDIKWIPSADSSKDAAYTRKYLTTIKKLAKKADSFTVATDYDVEGEVIGYNIVKHVCGKQDAYRMKFSTLTKDELSGSYDGKMSNLDWGQANAGLTRHELDWFYGINLSRALTSSIKATGSFKIMSSGRVQGPALKILAEREKEINNFKPEPFWQIELDGKLNSNDIEAWHSSDKIWNEEDANKIVERTKGRNAKVDDVNKRDFKQAPPTPFDLTTLQTESYKCLGISPKETLQIAQELYTSGVISYPRTSSQKLSEKLGFRNILKALSKDEKYKKLADKLMGGKLKPNNGKKDDPAHPAIYPTGALAKVEGKRFKVYDLIVRRFMATFGEPA
ncbi:MAG: DNA topoisomerase I, partial [Nanobdellota archaeon]